MNPLSYLTAIQGACKLSRHDALTRAAAVAGAVEAVMQGKASKAEWQALCMALNVMEAMVRQRTVKAERGAIEGMQKVLLLITQRGGSTALYAQEVHALQELSATYAEIMAHCTHSELFKAEEAVARRLAQVLRGNRDGAQMIDIKDTKK